MSWILIAGSIMALLKWRAIYRIGIGIVRFIGVPLYRAFAAFLSSSLKLSRFLLAPLAVWFIVSPDSAKNIIGDVSAPLTILILIGASVSILCAVTSGLRAAISVSFVLALSIIVLMKSDFAIPSFNFSKTFLSPQKKVVRASNRDELEYIDFTKKAPSRKSKASWMDQGSTVNVAAVEEKVRGFLSDDIGSLFRFQSKNRFSGLSDDMFFPNRSTKKQYYGFGIDDSSDETSFFSSFAKFLP